MLCRCSLMGPYVRKRTCGPLLSFPTFRNWDSLLSLQLGASLLNIQRGKVVEKSPSAVFGFELRQDSISQFRFRFPSLLCLCDSSPQRRNIVMKIAHVAGVSYVPMTGNEGCARMITLQFLQRLHPDFGRSIDQIREMRLPEKVSSEEHIRIRHQNDGISPSVPSHEADIQSSRAEEQIYAIIERQLWKDQSIHASFLLR